MSTPSEKIKIFRETFKGRDDVVPRYWQSNSGACGYSPMCRNEWKENTCQKPCRNCQYADYIPLSDDLLLNHFKGNHIIGVYPLLKSNTCHFIAADFDNHDSGRDPLSDVKAYYEVCQVQNILIYIARSKSGNGYHGYLFFDAAGPAWKARAVALGLLQEAQVIGDDVEISSFDRLFPNQDEATGKGFGNLIALPFQGHAAKKGHTLFLDPDTGFSKPYSDQWHVLASVKKMNESILDELIKEWNLEREMVSTNGYNGSAPKSEKTDKILECDFVKWCKENPEKVSEPLWYSLISNVISIRPGGVSFCHQLSRNYPEYSRAETDSKILQALDSSAPHTCNHIKSNGFKCQKDCGVKAPASFIYQKGNGDPTNETPKKRIEISIG